MGDQEPWTRWDRFLFRFTDELVRHPAMVLVVLALFLALIFRWGCWGNPDRDVVGTWGQFVVDGIPATDKSLTTTFTCDGRFIKRRGAATFLGTWRVERTAGRRILWTQLRGVEPPELLDISDHEPEEGELFRIEGQRMFVKGVRFQRGRPVHLLPPTTFASEPGYILGEGTRQ